MVYDTFYGYPKDGLHQVSIGKVSDYTKELFQAEDALTKFLVPYVYAKDLDQHAEKFLKKYCPRALEEPMPLPIDEIVSAMKLVVYPAPLPEGVFGRTYFNSTTAEIYSDVENGTIIEEDILSGTILFNPDVVMMRNIGSANNTIIVQATSRDILMYAMKTLQCCDIVAHVHDEIIIEADPEISLAALCEQMGRVPPWADGLLLRADGYVCDYYRKD